MTDPLVEALHALTFIVALGLASITCAILATGLRR